jgi:hypothetical protein
MPEREPESPSSILGSVIDPVPSVLTGLDLRD